MSYDFEAIGGVLLGIPEDCMDSLRATVEDSLLLAWLAARKNPAMVPQETLGKIGWVVSTGASQERETPLGEAGMAIIGGASDASLRSALSARLAATDRVDPVLSSWWENGSTGPFFALAGITGDGSIWLSRFTIELPEQRMVVFGHSPSARIVQSAISATLNTGAFNAAAKVVADKVAPHRDQIIRG